VVYVWVARVVTKTLDFDESALKAATYVCMCCPLYLLSFNHNHTYILCKLTYLIIIFIHILILSHIEGVSYFIGTYVLYRTLDGTWL